MDSTRASEVLAPGPQLWPAALAPRVYQNFAESKALVRRPELLGMLQNLAHSVSTLSACPCPIAVAPALGSQKEREEAVAVLAAVTAGGSIELVTLQQGMLQPLQPHVSVSLSRPLPALLSKTLLVLQVWIAGKVPVLFRRSQGPGAGRAVVGVHLARGQL